MDKIHRLQDIRCSYTLHINCSVSFIAVLVHMSDWAAWLGIVVTIRR